MNYEPNSKKFKTDKKITKVAAGHARKRNKLADVFIQEDVTDVKNYILMDVIVPAIKDTLANVVKNSIDMMLFGSTSTSNNRRGNMTNRVSYNTMSKPNGRSQYQHISTRDYDDIIFDSRSEAESVLDLMQEVLETYDTVSLADMFEMADISCPATYNDYGWDDLSSARTVRVTGGGYMIKLPKVKPLK